MWWTELPHQHIINRCCKRPHGSRATHQHYVTSFAFMIYWHFECTALRNVCSHHYASIWEVRLYHPTSALLVWSLLPTFIPLCYTCRGWMYQISAIFLRRRWVICWDDHNSSRSAASKDPLAVPRRGGHLDAVWNRKDLCIFHSAINTYSWETRQTFTEQFIFCLWEWQQWGEQQEADLPTAGNRAWRKGTEMQAMNTWIECGLYKAKGPAHVGYMDTQNMFWTVTDIGSETAGAIQERKKNNCVLCSCLQLGPC